MKSALQLVKPALAGPQATTPTSRMVKLSDGRAWAYGGTFCLSTPVQSPLECAFRPSAVEKFFDIERTEFTMTRQNGTLILKCGKAEDRIPVIPADEVPTLQAIGRRYPVTDQPVCLKEIAALAKNDTSDWSQCAWLIDGMLFAVRQGVMCLSANAFPAEVPRTGIPTASIQALSGIKSSLVSVVRDQQAIQFEFEDGTWLASRIIDMDTPDFMRHFEGLDGPDVFQEIVLSEGIVDEINARELYGEKDGQKLDMFWRGDKGVLHYTTADEECGMLEEAYTGAPDAFRIAGVSLRTVLALEPETLGLVYRNGRPSNMTALGDGFAVSAALSRLL